MEVWNSRMAQKIRASILDGIFRYCDFSTCPYLQSSSLPLQKACIGSLYEGIVKERRTSLNKLNVSLAIDPACNLRCISCRKESLTLSKKNQEKAKCVMEDVRKNLPSIDSILLTGNGEPFVSVPIRDFLFNLDASLYPDLKLFLLTNGQLFNHKNWDKMKAAQPAVRSVQVSIDAASRETYEAIRLGGSFTILMDNLKFISNLRQSRAIQEFSISFVVNARNFREMKDFVQLGMNLRCDQTYFSFMSNWGTFSAEDWTKMAVHLPPHKDHRELVNLLRDPIFNSPKVFLGNLGSLKPNRILSNDSLFV